MWEVAFETGFEGWVGVGIGPNGREGGMAFWEEEEYGRSNETKKIFTTQIITMV